MVAKTAMNDRLSSRLLTRMGLNDPRSAEKDEDQLKDLASLLAFPPRPVEIDLPDGTKTSIEDITEKLKNSLPLGDLKRKGNVYRKTITWNALLNFLKTNLRLVEMVAQMFARQLLSRRVLCQVTSDNFQTGGGDALYRLYCDHTPWVLNSYSYWKVSGSTTSTSGEFSGSFQLAPNAGSGGSTFSLSSVIDNVAVSEGDSPMAVTNRLDALLHEIEMAGLNPRTGKLDFKAVHSHTLFPRLEDAMGELQVIQLLSAFQGRPRQERLAFGLNVYHLCIKYAILKLGAIPSGSSGEEKGARSAFFKKVQLDLGKKLYSFEEFEKLLMHRKGWLACSETGSNCSDWDDSDSNASSAWTSGKDGGGPSSVFTLTPTEVGSTSNLTVQHMIQMSLRVGWAMGSSLSPPFRSFSSDRVMEELEVASRIFLNDDCNFSMDTSSRQLHVSSLLSTFAKREKKLIQMVLPQLNPTKRKQLEQFLDEGQKFKIKFHETDYTRNISNYPIFKETTLVADLKGAGGALFRRLKPPPTATNESLRWTTLRCLNLLDTLPEERFDRITRMVRDHFNVPLVFISLVDQNRQWFKSKQWMCKAIPEASETGRDISFCGHAILQGQDEILYIPDATKDDRFADNPLVTGPLNIRFYAGCNLSMPAVGQPDTIVNIGTLCIIDQKPRHSFSPRQHKELRAFALKVRDEIIARDKAHRPELDILARSSMTIANSRASPAAEPVRGH